MAEQTSHTRYIPLRLRLRASNQTISALGDSLRYTQPLVSDLSHVSETERRTQQIRELARLGSLLRADLGMDQVLQEIVASAAACTGFRILVMRLLDEETKQLTTVAFNGLPEEAQRMLSAAPISRETLQRLMQPEFRLSQSYFISHEHVGRYADKLLMLSKPADEYEPGTWHPDDLLFIPLYSPREQKLLGIISLDDPVDGKVPTTESIEFAQLFVHMAAMALDNVYLFQEREKERLALEEAISALCEDVEALHQNDFRHHIRAQHPRLELLANVINTLARETSEFLDTMRMVTSTVDEHMHKMQGHTQKFLHDTNQQETQVRNISQILSEMAKTMHHITESAALLARTAAEAADVALGAQNTVDRITKGTIMVRESTLRSARTMQGLIKSSQEINDVALTPTELTTRLHLLALNAAIEATRAGEQGRGFALIAQELRSLALSSKESAQKIEGYIRATQYETAVASQSLEESTQHAIVQAELATQAEVALDAINTITVQLPGLVQDICVVAENQSQGSHMAVNALNEVFHAKADITDHIQNIQQSMVHLIELTNLVRSRMALLRP
jgi:methyl-accepting chemotaxis protein